MNEIDACIYNPYYPSSLPFSFLPKSLIVLTALNSTFQSPSAPPAIDHQKQNNSQTLAGQLFNTGHGHNGLSQDQKEFFSGSAEDCFQNRKNKIYHL